MLRTVNLLLQTPVCSITSRARSVAFSRILPNRPFDDLLYLERPKETWLERAIRWTVIRMARKNDCSRRVRA